MRAVQFNQYGDTTVLNVVELPDPTPGPGEVVVRVEAAGINPGEVAIRNGSLDRLFPATFPSGEGSDFAGTVESVAADVVDVAVGDEVLGYTHGRASHAQLVAVPAGQVTPKPASLGWESAGALFVAGTTAYALTKTVGAGPKDVVVVSGAAGGVGSLTTQWARLQGARVIGLAGPANHGWLREHGIEPVDYHADDLSELVERILAIGQPTALIDTHGAPYPQLGVDLGVDPNRIASVVATSEPEKVGAHLVYHHETADTAMLAELAQAAASGRLDVEVAAAYPLEDVRQAFTELEHGHTRGKVVLRPN